MTIYVGNLSYDADHDSITLLFSNHGIVKKISLPIDKITGRKKGFCFIDFEEEAHEDLAISKLNEYEFLGRCLKVNKAMSNETKSGSGGGSSRPPFRGGDRSGGGGYGGNSSGGGYGGSRSSSGGGSGGSRSGSGGGSRGGFRSGSSAGYGSSSSSSSPRKSYSDN